MKKRPLWPLLALSSIVAACTCFEPRKSEVATGPQPGAPFTDRNCTNNVPHVGLLCAVFVDVKDCRVSVDASELGILTGSRDLRIYWIFRDTDADYRFAREGIRFKDESHKKEFDKPEPGRTVYSWRDRNDAGGQPFRPYHYTVTVLKADGTQCPPLDPTIINDL